MGAGKVAADALIAAGGGRDVLAEAIDTLFDAVKVMDAKDASLTARAVVVPAVKAAIDAEKAKIAAADALK